MTNRWAASALTAALALGAGAQALAQTPPAVLAWSEATAARLAVFLPRTSEGLTDALPWDVPPDYPSMNWACPIGCLQFTPANAMRAWRIDDPALAAAHAAAVTKAETDAVALTAAYGTISAEEFSRREKAIAESTDILTRSGRTVEMAIEANTLLERMGNEGAPGQAAPIHGLPVLRYTWLNDESYAPATEWIRLAIVLGPKDFVNPKVDDTKMQTGVRSITVWASLRTTPAKLSTDEAIVRRLLEQVDYEGLKALIGK